MVRNTRAVPPQYHDAANEERITSADLQDVTLDSDRYVEIWSQEGNSATAYGPGIGHKNRDYAQGYADLDLQNGVPGAIAGKLRWEVYDDPEKENLVAYSSTFRAENLRAAVSESLTEKPVMPAQMPLAGDDSFVVLALKADSANDGDTLTSANCDEDVGVPFSRYK